MMAPSRGGPMRSTMFAAALALAVAPAALAQSDPKAILTAAQEAIHDSHGISYTSEYKGTGALAAAVPQVSGQVKLARLAYARPLGAQVRVEGQTKPVKGDAALFQFVFDGNRVYS